MPKWNYLTERWDTNIDMAKARLVMYNSQFSFQENFPNLHTKRQREESIWDLASWWLLSVLVSINSYKNIFKDKIWEKSWKDREKQSERSNTCSVGVQMTKNRNWDREIIIG